MEVLSCKIPPLKLPPNHHVVLIVNMVSLKTAQRYKCFICQSHTFRNAIKICFKNEILILVRTTEPKPQCTHLSFQGAHQSAVGALYAHKHVLWNVVFFGGSLIFCQISSTPSTVDATIWTSKHLLLFNKRIPFIKMFFYNSYITRKYKSAEWECYINSLNGLFFLRRINAFVSWTKHNRICLTWCRVFCQWN